MRCTLDDGLVIESALREARDALFRDGTGREDGCVQRGLSRSLAPTGRARHAQTGSGSTSPRTRGLVNGNIRVPKACSISDVRRISALCGPLRKPVNVGRATQVISPALRGWCARDGHQCRTPGVTAPSARGAHVRCSGETMASPTHATWPRNAANATPHPPRPHQRSRDAMIPTATYTDEHGRPLIRQPGPVPPSGPPPTPDAHTGTLAARASTADGYGSSHGHRHPRHRASCVIERRMRRRSWGCLVSTAPGQPFIPRSRASHNHFGGHGVTPSLSTAANSCSGVCLGAAISAMEGTSGVMHLVDGAVPVVREAGEVLTSSTLAVEGHQMTQARAICHVGNREILTVNARGATGPSTDRPRGRCRRARADAERRSSVPPPIDGTSTSAWTSAGQGSPFESSMAVEAMVSGEWARLPM